MFIPCQATTGRPKKFSYREGRTKKLCIRVSELDLVKLERVCKYYGISKTDFILMSIYDEIGRICKKNEQNGHSENE